MQNFIRTVLLIAAASFIGCSDDGIYEPIEYPTDAGLDGSIAPDAFVPEQANSAKDAGTD